MYPFPKLKTSAELPINWKDRQNKKFYLSTYLPIIYFVELSLRKLTLGKSFM